MQIQNTLHDAMRSVLLDCPDRTATFTFVSDEIDRRGLYHQQENAKTPGGKAPANQIRLRARKYPRLFEIIPPDKVRLR